MCGRFTHEYTWREVRDFLDLELPPAPAPDLEPSLLPSYNVAPTQSVPVCRLDTNGQRELVPLIWGFKPGWIDPGKPGPINARCETVGTNPMFRGAFKSRRCLVPASGFYEWQKTGAPRKQPFYIRTLNDKIFCFAGIWEPGTSSDGTPGTFAILTTRPNPLVATIHDRMPVILHPSDHAAWLGGERVPLTLFDPFPADEMEAYPVSTRVNTPRNNEPTLRDRAAPLGHLFDQR